MKTMLMISLIISIIAASAAVAISGYDDGPDGLSSA
jgi:hypothetical protein